MSEITLQVQGGGEGREQETPWLLQSQNTIPIFVVHSLLPPVTEHISGTVSLVSYLNQLLKEPGPNPHLIFSEDSNVSTRVE